MKIMLALIVSLIEYTGICCVQIKWKNYSCFKQIPILSLSIRSILWDFTKASYTCILLLSNMHYAHINDSKKY